MVGNLEEEKKDLGFEHGEVLENVKQTHCYFFLNLGLKRCSYISHE